MSDTPHIRAQQLLAQSLVEGSVSPSDGAWLQQHLAECADCSREASSTGDILRALRAVPVQTPRDLAARTQMRLRVRASQSAVQPESSGSFLWIIAAMSWLLGVISAPLVWRGFAWLGDTFGVPKLVLQMGFVFWWTIPALFAVAVVLHQRAVATATKGL